MRMPRGTEFRVLLRSCAAALCLCYGGAALAADPVRVLMETTLGDIELELDRERAPVTVENFLGYVRSGFYNGSIFHRTIYDWIIQGGGYDIDLNELPAGDPIANEAQNGLKNVRGTIAMARIEDPHSADSQFFINLSDNDSLDYRIDTKRGWGYCVFGRVVRGMEVADAIGAGETGQVEGFGSNVPVEPVVIDRASVLE
jgi:peptidyl-prolyl cis-trans isomerase B (cyclophilin B)